VQQAESPEMKPAQVVIKKYANRRLYNSTDSRYVNLDDIAALVRQGKPVQVVDAQSGEDLTRVILTQIITEDAKDKPAGLPLELLRQLIVASDQAGQEFITWYLKSAFDSYEKVQEAVRNRLTDVQSAIFSPVEMMKRFTGRAENPREPEGELNALRNRVAELEARLNKPAATKARKPTRRRGIKKRS